MHVSVIGDAAFAALGLDRTRLYWDDSDRVLGESEGVFPDEDYSWVLEGLP